MPLLNLSFSTARGFRSVFRTLSNIYDEVLYSFIKLLKKIYKSFTRMFSQKYLLWWISLKKVTVHKRSLQILVTEIFEIYNQRTYSHLKIKCKVFTLLKSHIQNQYKNSIFAKNTEPYSVFWYRNFLLLFMKVTATLWHVPSVCCRFMLYFFILLFCLL